MSRFARTLLGVLVSAFLSQSAAAMVPAAFVPNRGQTDPRVQFLARTAGASFWFTRDEAVLSLLKEGGRVDLTLRFIQAEPTMTLHGAKPMEGKVNYLIGKDPSRWQTDLPMYGELVYDNVWPGIDVVFRDDGGTLKYEFHVAPRADVSKIRLQYGGAERVERGPRGDLLITTSLGTIVDARPVSYQVRRGKRVQIASKYVVGEEGRYGFAVGRYASGQPLVIDPGLAYSTFLGGTGADFATGIAVDSSGNAYVTGTTSSVDFPFNNGGPVSVSEAFVTKFDPSGTTVIYSTLIGGTDGDGAEAIALDATGSAYIVGATLSSDFPTTIGAFDTTLGGTADGFLVKLNSTGNGLLYSSYFGGSDTEFLTDLALDSSGGIYVTGLVSGLGAGSPDLPVTPGALYTGPNPWPVFVTKFTPAGALSYCTRLPFAGVHSSIFWHIAVDAPGNAYVAGDAFTGFATGGSYATTVRGQYDIGVAKLNPDGSQLVYATFIPGSARPCIECIPLPEELDTVADLAVDSAGNAYLTGTVTANDYPSTPGSFDPLRRGRNQGFVTKVNPTGTGLVYSTFIGPGTSTVFPFFQSRGGSSPSAIAVDGSGRAFLTGNAGGDFPTTADGYDTTVNVLNDAFVAVLDPAGAALEYSTFLGGTEPHERGTAIAVDAAGDVYVAGTTRSIDFPTTAGAFDTSFNGDTDAFVAKLDLQLPVIFQTFAANATLGGSSFEVKGTFTLAAMSDGINPVAEPVTLQVGDSVYDMPAGSFKRDKKGRFKFESRSLEIQIAPLAPRTFELKVDGTGIPAGNTAAVRLTIGNDKGTATSP